MRSANHQNRAKKISGLNAFWLDFLKNQNRGKVEARAFWGIPLKIKILKSGFLVFWGARRQEIFFWEREGENTEKERGVIYGEIEMGGIG